MQITENTIYNCDCMKVMQEMTRGGVKVDWCITDPPFGIKINHNMGRRKGDKPSEYKKTYWDNERIPKAYFDEIFKISKNQVIFGGNYYTDYLQPSPCWIIWDKGFSDEVTFAQCEMAWTNQTCSTKKIFCFPNGAEERIHPTQKPLKVWEFILTKFTKEGDLIFDPFAGSCSLAVACHKTNRRYICCEKDKEYYEKGCAWLKQVKAQISMFD